MSSKKTTLDVARNAAKQAGVVAAMPYDGIRGRLPEWMPAFFHQVFAVLQADLIMQYDNLDDVVRYIDAYADRLDLGPQARAVAPIPPHVLGSVGVLFSLRETCRIAAARGERAGLEHLLGGNLGRLFERSWKKEVELRAHNQNLRRDAHAKYEQLREPFEQLLRLNPSLSAARAAALLRDQPAARGLSQETIRRKAIPYLLKK